MSASAARVSLCEPSRHSVRRRSYLVKREARDGKNVSLSVIVVCEIRETLHEQRDSTLLLNEPS